MTETRLITTNWDEHIKITVHGRNWISNRYVAVRADLLNVIGPDHRSVPDIDPSKYPTRATTPATGAIGIYTAAVLWRNRDLAVMESDCPGIHALTRGGEMVGFATEGSPDSPLTLHADALERVYRVADILKYYVRNPDRWDPYDPPVDDEFLFEAVAHALAAADGLADS